MNNLEYLKKKGFCAFSCLLIVTQAVGCTSRTTFSKSNPTDSHSTAVASSDSSKSSSDSNLIVGNVSSSSSKTSTCEEAGTLGDVTCQPQDKQTIEKMLREASLLQDKPKSWMLWFGKKFLGVPYVGGTLDAAKEERLVINTTQLDCTTYVEMVVALTRCAENKKYTFADYCEQLKHVRYIGGEVAYEKRQHYFTAWINDNVEEGIVTDIQTNPPFTAVQHISVNWMTTHQSSYKMLNGNAVRLKGIKALENSINGKSYRYIPKSTIANNSLFRKTILDGDIIVIITNKKGLDTTHIGIASWHSDGLHLLNASSIHKKVIDEPMTLKTYMSKHPSQIGIRVCRVR